jgi:hypothetical protein
MFVCFVKWASVVNLFHYKSNLNNQGSGSANRMTHYKLLHFPANIRPQLPELLNLTVYLLGSKLPRVEISLNTRLKSS